MVAMNMFIAKRACFIIALLLIFRTGSRASDPALAVVNAGVAQEDNGAFAAGDYRFQPGDPLYVVFEIAGFQVKTDEEKDTRSISLTWEVTVMDRDNVPLAPAQNGEIKTGLSSEDKKWLPKRRAEFSLPELISAGEYRVHIVTKDLLSNTEAVKDIPFLIGGRTVEPSQTVGAQRIQFSREEGGPQLELPAYRPGDAIFLSFDITGFSETPEHEYRVSYRFDVLSPDGKMFVHQPQPVEVSARSFYPARFVPVNFAITTPGGSARGAYTVVLTITDEVANRTSNAKCTFTLE